MTLQARLDPAHHTGQATLTVGADQFHLVQPAVGKGIATYAITQLRLDGTSVTSTYDAYFVLQGEAWKLWFTARR